MLKMTCLKDAPCKKEFLLKKLGMHEKNSCNSDMGHTIFLTRANLSSVSLLGKNLNKTLLIYRLVRIEQEISPNCPKCKTHVFNRL